MHPTSGADLDTIGHSAAVRLFVERAQATKADFELTPSNAHADRRAVPTTRRRRVGDRARRSPSDGLHARGAVRSARPPVPRPRPGVDAPTVERHQTLRAAIDWSYDLLDDPDRCLLDRLGVFVGGFTLDAAAVVTAGGAARTATTSGSRWSTSCAAPSSSPNPTSTRPATGSWSRSASTPPSGSATAETPTRVRREHARYYVSFAQTAVPAFCGPRRDTSGRRASTMSSTTYAPPSTGPSTPATPTSPSAC